MKKGFLIDMDGVIYRGLQIIPGAVEFIRELTERKIPYIFLTNNSQRTRRDMLTKLKRMGFALDESNILTSAVATAEYLHHRKPGGTCYVIGEGGLLNALHDFNYSVVDRDPDFVVIGEGRTMSMENIEKAVKMLANGAKLIATNLDVNCPTENSQIRPGCGAIVKMIEEATGLKAFSAGKPSPVMFRAARKRLDLRTAETVMIGDTMETDVLGGVQMGYRTILVMSGATTHADLHRYAYQPDLIVDSIADLFKLELGIDPPESKN